MIGTGRILGRRPAGQVSLNYAWNFRPLLKSKFAFRIQYLIVVVFECQSFSPILAAGPQEPKEAGFEEDILTFPLDDEQGKTRSLRTSEAERNYQREKGSQIKP